MMSFQIRRDFRKSCIKIYIFFYLGAFFILKFQSFLFFIFYTALFLGWCKRNKLDGLYWVFSFFVFDCSLLPPRLLDLLSISRPLCPLPGPHEAATEWTVCAQLRPGILPSWGPLFRYGSMRRIQRWTEADCCQGGGPGCRKCTTSKPLLDSKAIHRLLASLPPGLF